MTTLQGVWRPLNFDAWRLKLAVLLDDLEVCCVIKKLILASSKRTQLQFDDKLVTLSFGAYKLSFEVDGKQHRYLPLPTTEADMQGLYECTEYEQGRFSVDILHVLDDELASDAKYGCYLSNTGMTLTSEWKTDQHVLASKFIRCDEQQDVAPHSPLGLGKAAPFRDSFNNELQILKESSMEIMKEWSVQQKASAVSRGLTVKTRKSQTTSLLHVAETAQREGLKRDSSALSLESAASGQKGLHVGCCGFAEAYSHIKLERESLLSGCLGGAEKPARKKPVRTRVVIKF